jgi:hypothetical protein
MRLTVTTDEKYVITDIKRVCSEVFLNKTLYTNNLIYYNDCTDP